MLSLKKNIRITWFFILFFLSISLIGTDCSAELDIIPLDQIKPGMKGIGRSVFQGYTIEEFPVEIVSIIPHIGPGQNMILGRLSGPLLDKSGVMQGISGSPVFIEGKLIGAVSSAWSFSREPLAGITPIEEMLSIMDRENETPSLNNQGQSKTGIIIDDFIGQSFYPPPAPFVKAINFPEYTASGFVPLRLPVLVSGISPQLLSQVNETIQPTAFQMVVGGQQGLLELPAPELEPGSSVGVDFVRGDMSMASVGTLTCIDGNRVLAFGHPMFQLGQTRFPMMHAYVHAIMSSDFISFKIASTTHELGSLVQDRISGVMGYIDDEVSMLPYSISLRYKNSDEKKDLNFEIVENTIFSPFAAYLVLLNTLNNLEKSSGDVTFTIKSELRLSGQKPLILENMYSSFNGFFDAGGEILSLFSILRNPFREIRPESLQTVLEIDERINISLIKECHVRSREIHPGDEVKLLIRLQPYQKSGLKTEKVSIQIPENLEPGNYKLTVADASWYSRTTMRRTPQYFSLFTLEQLYRLLNDNVQQNKIYITLSHFKPGLTFRGENYNNVPSSLLKVVNPSPQAGDGSIFRESIIAEHHIELDSVVQGFKFVTFKVVND